MERFLGLALIIEVVDLIYISYRKIKQIKIKNKQICRRHALNNAVGPPSR